MGLDMYLSKNVHISGYEFYGEEAQKKYQTVVDLVGWEPLEHTPSADVEIVVAYWRKANAIHRWFVDNVQNGIDECERNDVTLEELLQLRGLCQKVLDAVPPEDADDDAIEAFKKFADETLPSQRGFFFGPTEYDDWYLGDLRHTIEQIDTIHRLSEPSIEQQKELIKKYNDKHTPESRIYFTYQSSW